MMAVVLVEVVDDPLARGRIDVIRENVDRLSADRRSGCVEAGPAMDAASQSPRGAQSSSVNTR